MEALRCAPVEPRGMREMGIVLSFTPQSAATKKPSRTGGTSAVVIFPGVRYERAEAGGVAPQVKAPRLQVELPPLPKH